MRRDHHATVVMIRPMAHLTILEYPDPRLRTKAKPVEVVDDHIRQLVSDLFETMYEAEDYHQNYFNQNGSQPYCSFVIQPKVEKFEKE